MTAGLLSPHGGELINRMVSTADRAEWIRKVDSLEAITLNHRELADLDMIACGALSPLVGFMGSKDYQKVCDDMHLANGIPWTLPITLSIKKEDEAKYKEGNDVALFDS